MTEEIGDESVTPHKSGGEQVERLHSSRNVSYIVRGEALFYCVGRSLHGYSNVLFRRESITGVLVIFGAAESGQCGSS